MRNRFQQSFFLFRVIDCMQKAGKNERYSEVLVLASQRG